MASCHCPDLLFLHLPHLSISNTFWDSPNFECSFNLNNSPQCLFEFETLTFLHATIVHILYTRYVTSKHIHLQALIDVKFCFQRVRRGANKYSSKSREVLQHDG